MDDDDDDNIEVCMEIRIPVRTGFPWKSYRNGTSFLTANWNENNDMGIRMADCMYVCKKFRFAQQTDEQ